MRELFSFYVRLAYHTVILSYLAMRTSCPATRTTHTTIELGYRFLNTNTSCLSLLARRYPANPFTTREWCDVFPHGARFHGSRQRFTQVLWQRVHRAGGQVLHMVIISKYSYQKSVGTFYVHR